MTTRTASKKASKRTGCFVCGRCVEDGTVKEVDQWIVEGGDLICPNCQIHEVHVAS